MVLPSFKTCNETENARWRNGSVTKALFPFSQCPWKPWSIFIFLCGYQWSAASRGKGFGHWPPEERAGELSTSCKQAISVSQGTVLPCTAENVGSCLCSVKFREERILPHHPPASLCSSAAFQSPSQCPVTILMVMMRYFIMSSSKCKSFLKTTVGYFRESDMRQGKQKYAWHLHMEVINANLYCKFRAGVVRRDFPWCVHCCHLTCWVLSLKLDLKDDGKFLNPRTNTYLNAI